MDEQPSGDETRRVLRNVAAYRELCRRVRAGSTGNLFFGVFMLAIWYFLLPKGEQLGLFGLLYLALAALEFTAGIFNRFFPAPEGILIEGLVTMAFGLSTVARQIIAGQFSGYLLLAAFWLYHGFGQMRSYFQIRSEFPERPTSAHLRWFEDLLHDVRNANPDDDPTALDLPTKPAYRAKLLGDSAFFLASGKDDLLILAREDVEIERDAPKDADRPIMGYLVLLDTDFGSFKLDPENWRNYAQWKTEGGTPPPAMRSANEQLGR